VPQFQQADFHLQQRIGHSTVSEILPFLFYNKSLEIMQIRCKKVKNSLQVLYLHIQNRDEELQYTASGLNTSAEK
jgi:hypothetical protein